MLDGGAHVAWGEIGVRVHLHRTEFDDVEDLFVFPEALMKKEGVPFRHDGVDGDDPPPEKGGGQGDSDQRPEDSEESFEGEINLLGGSHMVG